MNSMYAFCLVMILCISQCQMQRTESGTCKRKFTDCKNIEEQVAPEAPEKLSDINKDSSATKCFSSVLEQINMEFTASLVYLQMGAHFSRDVVNLPGFAKFFFDSASEEREHGIKLINYLLMRGDTLQENDLKDPQDKALIVFPSIEKTEWLSGLDALHDALTLERKVTESIKLLIKACDNDRTIELLNKNRVTGYIQDYHITDWLTAEYLDEQYKGQRELAGKIFTLSKLIEKDSHKNLGEFIFDKKLLGVDL